MPCAIRLKNVCTAPADGTAGECAGGAHQGLKSWLLMGVVVSTW